MKILIILFQLAYFNQQPPKDESVVFAPGIVSIDTVAEFGSTFSKDLTEFFFAIERKNGKAETWYRTSDKSVPLLVHETYSYNDPMLSPDQKRLYFISDQPLSGTGQKKDFDIWYIERKGNGWSKPINSGPNINSNKNEYYVSFTASGTMYFSSGRTGDHDIYSAKADGRGFKPAEKVAGINTNEYEGDVFIAPDESYMIVACARAANIISGGDLYITTKDQQGNWTPLKNMGPKINGPRFDYCPFVTPDGKYLFYTRAEEIRWVPFTR